MKQIILASSSPRRKALLKQIGLEFKIDASNIEEKLNPRLKPRGNAEQLSLAKAQAVSERYDDALIIAADTFIVLGDEIIGKPKDGKEAKRTLNKISGRSFSVITGFTILDKAKRKTVTKSVETKIFFKNLSKKEIADYIASEEPLDAAGGFKLQERGAVFIEKIEGDYYNVVGLPLNVLYEELRKFDVEFF